jgi:hypothetical protein
MPACAFDTAQNELLSRFVSGFDHQNKLIKHLALKL